ncbi:hypothetical protein KX816_09035 [Sphingosinicellaceae bacterium]|nr:hypothetical protein KX816_09035 [Sphingosinicellaceae bacterium]
MSSQHDWRVCALLSLGSMLLALPSNRAGASVKYDLAAEGDVTAANNPLLLGGSDRSALVGDVSIKPGATWTGDTGSTLALNGILTSRNYSRRYGSFLLGQARAEGIVRHDERLTGRASLSFNRDISADILTEAVDTTVDPRSTRNAWDAATSLTWTPSARTTITPRLDFTSARFSDSRALGTSKVYTAELRVARRLSGRTSLGIAVLGNRSDVSNTGQFETQSVLATLDRQFGPAVHLTTEAGFERVRDRLAGSAAINFSGRGELCVRGERNRACLDASLASQASAIGTLQKRLAVGGNVHRAIGEYWDLGLAADYQRASRSGVGAAPTLSAATARCTLDWRFTKALTLGSRLEYRQRDLGVGSALSSGYAGMSLQWRR